MKLELNITTTTVRLFQILYVDRKTIENVKLLTIVNAFFEHAQAYKLVSAQSIETASNLIKYLTHHCIPEQIIYDVEFKCTVLTEFFNSKIKIHFIRTQQKLTKCFILH